MEISAEVLRLLEEGDDETKTNRVKELFHLESERNARVVLNIIENSRDKWLEKISKEIKKMELKKIKEYRKMNKKMESFSYMDTSIEHSKLGRINHDIAELKSLL